METKLFACLNNKHCNKSFQYRSYLNKHMKICKHNKAGSNAVFICPNCCSKLKRPDNLQRHLLYSCKGRSAASQRENKLSSESKTIMKKRKRVDILTSTDSESEYVRKRKKTRNVLPSIRREKKSIKATINLITSSESESDSIPISKNFQTNPIPRCSIQLGSPSPPRR